MSIPAFLLTVALAAASCGSGGGGGSPTGPGGSGGSKELNSGDIHPGGTFTHRFTTAGNFHYHCLHHPTVMTGDVVVTNAALDTLVNVSIVSSVTAFHSATVKPGGRVRWTNNDGMTHTVTSD